MADLLRSSDQLYSQEGKALKDIVRHGVEFYKSLSSSQESSIVKHASGYMPGVDSFLDKFIGHYNSNEDFKQSLIVTLVKAYVAKVEGVDNPHYGSKVLNFFMALAASGDKKAFEYVSGNLCDVSLRWIKTLMAAGEDLLLST